MLSVIKLNVVMLNVVVPEKHFEDSPLFVCKQVNGAYQKTMFLQVAQLCQLCNYSVFLESLLIIFY